MRTRFAPTPSGYPHVGNAVNAVLCARLAKEISGELILRVDDVDTQRQRPEYREAISALVEWLNLPITAVREHQNLSIDRYWMQLQNLAKAHPGAVYVCSCTRSQLDSGMSCSCARSLNEWHINETRICMRIEGEVTVLWRREGIPAYHLTSVVDDDDLGITHVVRGEDLRASTMIQRELSRRIPGSTFFDTWVAHHSLLLDHTGIKLSKSSGRHSAHLRLDAETKAEVERLATELWDRDIAPQI